MKIRVSFCQSYSLSWGSSTRRVDFLLRIQNPSLLDDFGASNSSIFYTKMNNYELNTYQEPDVTVVVGKVIST